MRLKVGAAVIEELWGVQCEKMQWCVFECKPNDVFGSDNSGEDNSGQGACMCNLKFIPIVKAKMIV